MIPEIEEEKIQEKCSKSANEIINHSNCNSSGESWLDKPNFE